MANNQRKMTRRMSPGGGSPNFDAPLVPRGMRVRNTAENRAVKRAAKKQIKTNEERAWRAESHGPVSE